jgi:hypothetical protein
LRPSRRGAVVVDRFRFLEKIRRGASRDRAPRTQRRCGMVDGQKGEGPMARAGSVVGPPAAAIADVVEARSLTSGPTDVARWSTVGWSMGTDRRG